MANRSAPRVHAVGTHPSTRNSHTSASAARRGRVRLRLLLWLALLAAVFFGGFWYAGGRINLLGPKCVATAFLEVAVEPPMMVGRPRYGAEEFATFKRTQALMMTNPYVLNAALRDDKVANLPMIKDLPGGPEEKVKFLQDSIIASYPYDATLLRVAMAGNDPEQLKTIVDAVVDAYLKEVVSKERLARQTRYQALEDLLRRNRTAITTMKDNITKLGETQQANGALQAEVLDRELLAAHEELIEARRTANELELETALLNAKLQATREQAPDVDDETLAARLKDSAEYQDLQERILAVQRRLDEMDQATPEAEQGEDSVAGRLKEQLTRLENSATKLRAQIKSEAANRAKAAKTQRVAEELALANGSYMLRKQHVDRLAKRLEELQANKRTHSKQAFEIEQKNEELAQLQDVTDKIATEYEVLKIELNSPPRVELLERATVSRRGWIEHVQEERDVAAVP